MSGDRDDDDWFEAIAGRPRPGTDARTLLEATWLRSAVRAWAPAPVPEGALLPDAADRLIERARAEGLLSRRGWCIGCAARWRRWREAFGARGMAGLAFAVLAVAVVLGVWRPAHQGAPDETAPVLRGAPADGVWLLRAADPAARREAIAAELTAAGVTFTRYERLGRFGLDADLGAARSAALLQALRRLGVQPAPDGSLRVEIEPAAP